MKIRELLKLSPVIPVLELDDVKTAPELARALCAGGAPVLEITLRTDNAFEIMACLLYTSPSPRDKRQSRMPSSA